MRGRTCAIHPGRSAQYPHTGLYDGGLAGGLRPEFPLGPALYLMLSACIFTLIAAAALTTGSGGRQ